MDPSLLLSFIGASILLTIMPGPDNIFVLTESITNGARTGIRISLGLVSGIFIHTAAAATGLSIILLNSPQAFTVVKFLGAGYLFYLAFTSLNEKNQAIDYSLVKIERNSNFFALYRKGFFMNVLNPKVSLFFIALLPQFITPSGLNVTLQMLILGLIFILQALPIFFAISYLSGKLVNFVHKPKFWQVTKWMKVFVLSILAITLLLSKA